MSLYAPSKPDLVCRRDVQRMRTEWGTVALEADLIVIVGARRALVSDPHIWDPIIKSSAPVGFVGGNSQPLLEMIGNRLTVLGDMFAAGLEPLNQWLYA
jgi:hypothetical protein